MSNRETASHSLFEREGIQLPDRRDCSIEAIAQARLRECAYLELRRVSSRLEGRVLRLQGYVSSYYLRQVAQALCQGIDGVNVIDNQLEVVPSRLKRHPESF